MATPTPVVYNVESGKTGRGGRTAPFVPYQAFVDTFDSITFTQYADGAMSAVHDGRPMLFELHGSSGANTTNGRQYRAQVSGRMAYQAETEYGFSLVASSDIYTNDPASLHYPKIRPIDRYGLFPENGQYRESFFGGFWGMGSPNYVQLITARRVDANVLWAKTQLPQYDYTRACLLGYSMGADACFTYGIRRPDLFAAIYPDRGRVRYDGTTTNVIIPKWTTKLERLSGAAIPDIAPEDGGGKFKDYNDAVAYVANPNNKLPLIVMGMGRQDPNYTPADYAALVAALRSRKAPFCLVWDNEGHGSQAIRRGIASYPFGTVQIGKSYPYLSNSSLDKDILVDPVGGNNEGYKWRNVSDTASGWSVEITNILGACQVDVEPHAPVNYPAGATAKRATITAVNAWTTISFP